jgi:hypothetical protein
LDLEVSRCCQETLLLELEEAAWDGLSLEGNSPQSNMAVENHGRSLP